MKLVGAVELARDPPSSPYERERKFVFLELYARTTDFVWKSITAQAQEQLRRLQDTAQAEGSTAGTSITSTGTKRILWLVYVSAKFYTIVNPSTSALSYEDYIKKRSLFAYYVHFSVKGSRRLKRPVKFEAAESSIPKALKELNGFIPTVIEIMEPHTPAQGRAGSVPKSPSIPKYSRNPEDSDSSNRLVQAKVKLKSALPGKPDPVPGLADKILASARYMKAHMLMVQRMEEEVNGPPTYSPTAQGTSTLPVRLR